MYIQLFNAAKHESILNFIRVKIHLYTNETFRNCLVDKTAVFRWRTKEGRSKQQEKKPN